MNLPDLDRMWETFILIPGDYEEGKKIIGWQEYVHFLSEKIVPIVQELERYSLIDWYCFLVHDRSSGVPLQEKGLYIHLRFVLVDPSDADNLPDLLPEYCLGTRKMTKPCTLDSVEVDALKSYEEGWRILGESSEWVLRMIEGHRMELVIPPVNIMQFRHYMDNQLLVPILEEYREKMKGEELGWLYRKLRSLLQRMETRKENEDVEIAT